MTANKIKGLIEIVRPRQWYKNSLVFVGIVFAQKLNMIYLYPIELLGFLTLSGASGAIYAINDILDREKDKINQVKASNPIRSSNSESSYSLRRSVTSLLAFHSIFARN